MLFYACFFLENIITFFFMKFLMLTVFTLYPSIVLGGFGPHETTKDEKKIIEKENQEKNMKEIAKEIEESKKENIDPKKK